MESRSHFMPLSLLESQLDTLEIPKKGLHLDAMSELNELIQQIKSNLDDA
jgi:gluconate kinase